MIDGIPATAVFVLAMIEMLKKLPVFDCDGARRWLPLLAVALGVVFNVLSEGDNSRAVIFDGLFYGLMAGGTFCAFKQLGGKKEAPVALINPPEYVKNYEDEE